MSITTLSLPLLRPEYWFTLNITLLCSWNRPNTFISRKPIRAATGGWRPQGQDGSVLSDREGVCFLSWGREWVCSYLMELQGCSSVTSHFRLRVSYDTQQFVQTGFGMREELLKKGYSKSPCLCWRGFEQMIRTLLIVSELLRSICGGWSFRTAKLSLRNNLLPQKCTAARVSLLTLQLTVSFVRGEKSVVGAKITWDDERYLITIERW